MVEYLDVIVVGAGISGIDAAYNLRTRCPDLSYVVLERRASFGGTWDLFKYPGFRSDSDMFTFGFDFRPWPSPKPIAPGADIKKYLNGVIEEEDLARNIRYEHHIVRADWSSERSRWQLECDNGSRFECCFLFSCTGYYEYDEAWEPPFEGSDSFLAAGGRIVHPQKWTSDVVYEGKNVAVIGSGATAVTLIPSIAQHAKHVVMVQRSPTYIVALPNSDPVAEEALKAGLSHEEVHRRVREYKAQQMQSWTTSGEFAQMTQEQKNNMFINFMRMALPEKHMSEEEFRKHFAPKYNIWEQRLCVCPDGDFFRAIRRKKASIVTDHIKRFDERGIVLESGERVDADLIVTATGLQLHHNPPMATMQVTVDGVPYVGHEHHIYQDCMLSDVPNFAFIRGYFQASWTLKADIVCHWLCRLLQHMRLQNHVKVMPRLPAGGVGEPPEGVVSSSYVVRSAQVQPSYGSALPWFPLQNFPHDKKYLEEQPLEDGVLEFSGTAQVAAQGSLRSRL